MSRRRHLTLAATLCAASVTVFSGAQARAEDHTARHTQAVHVDAADVASLDGHELRGAAAIEALDDTDATADVAEAAGIDAHQLVDELAADDLMFLTETGLVGYTEPAVHTADAPADGPADAAPGGSEAAPLSAIPALSSRPSSTRTIFLDFDGATVTGSYWNAGGGPNPLTVAAYDMDGDPTTFTTAELDAIRTIHERVSEDYAAFDVNVTTVDPGRDGIVRTNANDNAYGTRVIITSSDWYNQLNGSQVGGVAYVGTFGSQGDHPAWVFTKHLAGGAGHIVSETVSHEAGHTLGLLHDGVGDYAYWYGTEHWAPIMGVSYGKPIAQWSRGDYPGANNTQDDLSIIATRTGYVSDDYANTPIGAHQLTSGKAVTGLLSPSDVDQFTINAAAGWLEVTVTGAKPASTNAFASVTVYDSSGRPVIAGGPDRVANWSAAGRANVTEGTYRIVVAGTGWKTPATGFSAYGSVGTYRIVATAGQPDTPTTTTPTTTVPPDPADPGPTTTVPATDPAGDPGTTSTVPADDNATLPGAGVAPISPTRVVDTREGLGGRTRVRAGKTMVVDVAAAGTIPRTATSAILNVTAVNPDGAGYLTVHPCGTEPGTSTLNYVAGDVIANTTIAAVEDGITCIFTLAETDILVDVTAWLGDDADGRADISEEASRVADTRNGPRPLAGSTTKIELAGRIPEGTTAVALNVTAVDPDGPGHLTVWPCNQPQPATSLVNYTAGDVRPNNTIVGVGDGRVCVYTHAGVDIVADLTVTFSADGPLGYIPAGPVRSLDTRVTDGKLRGRLPRRITEGAMAPDDAQAVSVNAVTVDHTEPGWTALHPCGATPQTSTLNQTPGEVVANGALVTLGIGQAACATMSAGGHLVVDVTGWWVGP